MAANSAVRGRILPKLELIPAVMVVLLTCKNEEDPIKNEGARVVTTLYINFSDAQGQMKKKMIQSKMKALEWPTHISNCKFMGIFPDAQGQLTPHSVVESGRNSNSV